MKLQNLLTFTPVLLLSLNLLAQGPGSTGAGVTLWKTNGNIADENHFIGTKNEFPIKFRTNDVERLRISPDGNVGIGTSAPESKLDVFGNVMLRNNLILPGLSNTNSLTNKFLLIDELGNVTKATHDQITSLIYQSKYCDGGPITSPTWANGINKIYVECPQVNVGIGTNAPNYSLDVRGYGYLQDGLKIGGDLTNINMPALIEGYHGLNNARPWLRFTTTNNGVKETAFLVNKDGGLYCTSVRVRLREDIPVPDYVFKPEYELMPLTELKTFVTINSHLPNIPSEKEIKEEGLSLEEMQLKLLQKIEELTLYVIEISEENEKLQLKNEELDKKIEELNR